MAWALLDGLPDADRRRVLASARQRRYAKGEVVYHQDDLADALHLIGSGHFAVSILTAAGDTATLALLGTGDMFGELALFDSNARRSATVTALDRGETLALSRDAVEQLRATSPAVDRLLLDTLATQVRRLTGHLAEALYQPVEIRVWRRLLAAARLWQADRPGGLLPITQDVLAGLAGTTRPTVNRVLAEAADAGVVLLHRGRIELLDPAAIARRAAGH